VIVVGKVDGKLGRYEGWVTDSIGDAAGFVYEIKFVDENVLECPIYECNISEAENASRPLEIETARIHFEIYKITVFLHGT